MIGKDEKMKDEGRHGSVILSEAEWEGLSEGSQITTLEMSECGGEAHPRIRSIFRNQRSHVTEILSPPSLTRFSQLEILRSRPPLLLAQDDPSSFILPPSSFE